MNLRIQTLGTLFVPSYSIHTDRAENTTALEALEKGMDDLMDLCDVVTDKFTTARDAFNATEADRMKA